MFRKLILCVPQCHFHRKYSSAGPLGFIGLGNMGLRLAEKLIKSGNKVVGYDKVKTKAGKLIDIGLETADSPAAVAQKCKIIFTSLPHYKAMAEVCGGKDGIVTMVQPKTVLVDFSTIGPVNTEYLYAVLRQYNIEFLSAPISGGNHTDLESADHIFLVGGSKETLKRVEVYLRQLGKSKNVNNIHHIGNDIGDGQTARLCNLLLLACAMVGTAEIMNLGMRLGVDPKVLAQGLDNSTAQCWSCSSYNPIPNVVPNSPACNDYKPGESVEVLMEALQIAQDVATKMRAPIPLGALACQIFNIALSRGYGQKDFSVVYKVLRQSIMPGV